MDPIEQSNMEIQQAKEFILKIYSKRPKKIADLNIDEILDKDDELTDDIIEHLKYLDEYKKTFERYIEALREVRTVTEEEKASLWETNKVVMDRRDKTCRAKIRKRIWEYIEKSKRL